MGPGARGLIPSKTFPPHEETATTIDADGPAREPEGTRAAAGLAPPATGPDVPHAREGAFWLYRLVTAICLGGPLAASLVIPPPSAAGAEPSGLLGLPCCLFKELTGLPCPFCGLTRSFVSLGHGRIEDAFKYHLLGPFLFAGFFLGLVHTLLRRSPPGPSSPQGRVSSFLARHGLHLFLLSLLAAWVVKLAFLPARYW